MDPDPGKTERVPVSLAAPPLPVSDEPHDIVCVIVARHPMRTELLDRDTGPLDA